MKRLICLFIIVLVTLAAFSPRNASAFILLSGDVNIDINTDQPADNETFFRNTIGTGSTVKILDGFFLGNGSAFNDIYNSFTGVTSTLLLSDQTITATILEDVDLFVSTTPVDEFESDETQVMSDFLAGGGDIFFIGDWAPGFNDFNERINEALTALESSMSLDLEGPIQDGSLSTTTNILDHPLTSEVDSFTYSAFTKVFGGTGIIGSDTPDISGEARTIIAYESTAEAEPVPEPATIALLGIGLVGLAGGAVRRKWKKKAVDKS